MKLVEIGFVQRRHRSIIHRPATVEGSCTSRTLPSIWRSSFSVVLLQDIFLSHKLSSFWISFHYCTKRRGLRKTYFCDGLVKSPKTQPKSCENIIFSDEAIFHQQPSYPTASTRPSALVKSFMHFAMSSTC